MVKTVYITCTGCPESRFDSARVEQFLKENGWAVTKNIKTADVVLFRACGLTGTTTNDSLQIIRMIKAEKRDDSKFIVWGCLPKIDMDALRTEYTGITFGEEDISLLNKILNPEKPIEEITSNSTMSVFEIKRSGLEGSLRRLQDFSQKFFSIAQNKEIFHIKVSTGCLGSCSFCAIRKSRGSVRSKNIDEIIFEFRNGLEKGFRYFSLLATDLGAYGRDVGLTLVDLLEALLELPGNYKIGLRNINPYFLNEMFEDLKPFLGSGKIWFLSTAAESGSNRILKLMGRRYTIQDFKKCIKALNKDYPQIFLRTQLLVGFPTETDYDFRQSLDLLDELAFDWVEVYPYSPRKGTVAAGLDGQISEKTKRVRLYQLSLKAFLKNPHKKVKQIIQSSLKSHCEKQDFMPKK